MVRDALYGAGPAVRGTGCRYLGEADRIRRGGRPGIKERSGRIHEDRGPVVRVIER